MLEKQRLIIENDERGTVRLLNTYNIKEELELAQELARSGGETVKVGHGFEVKPMGFIPSEMWLYDPWLIEADRARKAGDMGEFTRLLQKFFEIHPSLKPPIRKKYY